MNKFYIIKNIIKIKMENNNNINITKLVKSFFILKKIFSHLNDRIKLKMFVHNTKLQRTYGFNLDYYKNSSGKYRKLDKDGNGKEYDFKTNKLIFEGQYKHGKKNGIGK